MAQNERLWPGVVGSPASTRQRHARRGVRAPSPRSVNGLLDWIGTAQQLDAAVIGRFVAVAVAVLALTLLASAAGLIPR